MFVGEGSINSASKISLFRLQSPSSTLLVVKAQETHESDPKSSETSTLLVDVVATTDKRTRMDVISSSTIYRRVGLLIQ